MCIRDSCPTLTGKGPITKPCTSSKTRRVLSSETRAALIVGAHPRCGGDRRWQETRRTPSAAPRLPSCPSACRAAALSAAPGLPPAPQGERTAGPGSFDNSINAGATQACQRAHLLLHVEVPRALGHADADRALIWASFCLSICEHDRSFCNRNCDSTRSRAAPAHLHHVELAGAQRLVLGQALGGLGDDLQA